MMLRTLWLEHSAVKGCLLNMGIHNFQKFIRDLFRHDIGGLGGRVTGILIVGKPVPMTEMLRLGIKMIRPQFVQIDVGNILLLGKLL